MIFWWLGLSIVGAILGRLGGKKGFNTKFRDIGLPCVFGLYLWHLGVFKGIFSLIWLIPSLILMTLALTTYRYFLPKPKDYSWWHYSLHGFMVSSAVFPLMFSSGHWLGFGMRCIVNSILVGLWSHFISQDDLEEGGRYFIIIATIPLLLI